MQHFKKCSKKWYTTVQQPINPFHPQLIEKTIMISDCVPVQAISDSKTITFCNYIVRITNLIVNGCEIQAIFIIDILTDEVFYTCKKQTTVFLKYKMDMMDNLVLISLGDHYYYDIINFKEKILITTTDITYDNGCTNYDKNTFNNYMKIGDYNVTFNTQNFYIRMNYEYVGSVAISISTDDVMMMPSYEKLVISSRTSIRLIMCN